VSVPGPVDFPEGFAEKVAPLLAEFFPRQRWFTGDEPPTRVEVTVIDRLERDPVLAWLLVDVTLVDGSTATYQLVLGGRHADDPQQFMRGKERVTVGSIDGLIFYDALVDPELALVVLDKVAPGEPAKVARPLLVEQSNTSVVYDERLILKFFRRVHAEPNPDVEVTRVLGARGFPHVVPQLEPLRRQGSDLGVVRQFLLGATDAWDLAHTSLRDLLGTPVPPEEAGGDFAPEAATLGDVIARLHLMLAEAYGTEPGEAGQWLSGFRAQLGRLASHPPADPGSHGGPRIVPANVVDVGGVAKAFDDLASVGDPGVAIKVHGDLHLGQLLLADAGWFVIDFEGEPARPVAERMLPSSPLRDVAGMLRSFQYAARTALVERGRDLDAELVAVADAWEARAVDAFWQGYSHVDGIEALLPADAEDRLKLLRAFELDKAVYEVVYELGHRPDWVDVPASAIRRALALVA
jgi:maltokinase